MLKLGLGRLAGAPGEVFKILDDPLGDRCNMLRYIGHDFCTHQICYNRSTITLMQCLTRPYLLVARNAGNMNA